MSDESLPVTLAGISKAVAELNKPHRDERQIRIAEILFDWWMEHGRGAMWDWLDIERPVWSDAIPEAQAFWMDFAWAVGRG